MFSEWRGMLHGGRRPSTTRTASANDRQWKGSPVVWTARCVATCGHIHTLLPLRLAHWSPCHLTCQQSMVLWHRTYQVIGNCEYRLNRVCFSRENESYVGEAGWVVKASDYGWFRIWILTEPVVSKKWGVKSLAKKWNTLGGSVDEAGRSAVCWASALIPADSDELYQQCIQET